MTFNYARRARRADRRSVRRDLARRDVFTTADEQPNVKRDRSRVHAVRAAAVAPKSFNDASRSVNAICSTDFAVRIYDWGTDTIVDEVLLPSGMRTAGDSVPLIVAHNHYDPMAVIGSVDTLTRDGQVSGRLVFSTASDVDPIYTRVREGHLKNVSIGATYTRNDYIEIQAGKTREIAGRTYTATDVSMRLVRRWTLEEVSVVTFGADPNAKTRNKKLLANRNSKKLS